MFTRFLIDFSLKNKWIVLLATCALIFGGVRALQNLPLDAIPDLSDTQVILYTQWAGQAPHIVQDQVTYPITTRMLSIPKAKTVRGYSFYGFSFVYIIFNEGTDIYWARSRVLEYLDTLKSELPPNVVPTLGPDATGTGWAFMYSLNSKKHSLAELRSIQDWYLKYQLSSVEGVAEVASVGGFVKQYQITVDPVKLRAYRLSIGDIKRAVQASNGEVGGRSIEMAEKEFILRIQGYLEGIDDLRKVVVGTGDKGIPLYLDQVANIQLGPDMRRGIAEWNGEGETVGGIVVVRHGANTLEVIQKVKAKLKSAMQALPDIEASVAYDRSALIHRSVNTLKEKLLEECTVVGLTCLLFLLHFRSALIPILLLPTAILISFLIMQFQGIGSNIMSLGGIAIAIGTMVDASIIMIDNVHKHLEQKDENTSHWEIVRNAAVEVGPTLFGSLLVITVSFMPIFALQAQEGKLFAPLAYTKTYAMAASAFLAVTLAPILMGYFIRGKITPEEKNPVSRFLMSLYHPFIEKILRFPRLVIMIAFCSLITVFFPWNRWVVDPLPEGQMKTLAQKLAFFFPFQSLGSEFMPPLYEGDLLYMPTTFPGISATKAKELVQQTDKIIKSFGEVESVFGKAGRAETATDPAPFDMLETTIRLKDEKEWPKVAIQLPNGRTVHRRRTPDELINALNAAIQFPGLSNAWTMPIKARIDMLSTGIRTPVGIKVAGTDLTELERIAAEVEGVMRQVPGTSSVFAERVMGGNYIEFHIDRDAIARYGLTVKAVQEVLEVALGGMPLTTTVEGLERYTVTLRYDRDFRNNLEALQSILITTPQGAQIPLSQLAKLQMVRAPMSIKSETAIPNAWIYVDVRDTDLGGYIKKAQKAVDQAISQGDIHLPRGYQLLWSGHYEYMKRAEERLLIVIPITLLITFLIIYISTHSLIKTVIVGLAVPFSLIGAFWMLHLFGYNLSVAVWVGIIALAGLDAETGLIMLLYLDIAFDQRKAQGKMKNLNDLKMAIHEGAVKRIRPKTMTAATIIFGLVPILWSNGTGADVMKRIATPMVGGVVTSSLMEFLVYPAIFYLWRYTQVKKQALSFPKTN